MAEAFLRNHPGLRPFVLSDVQLTGTEIGGGAYGKVEEVVVPVGAARQNHLQLLARKYAFPSRECLPHAPATHERAQILG